MRRRRRKLRQRIKLVQGSYDLGNTVWDNNSTFGVIAGGSKLLGGYTTGCTGRDIARGNTVLDDTNDPGNPQVIIHGDLTLEGLTWHTSPWINANNIGDEDFGPPPGTIDLPPDTEVLIRRNAFINSGFTIDWGQDYDVGGTIRVVDTLLMDEGACAVDLRVIAGGDPDIELINDTIIGATCAANHYNDGWGGGAPVIYADNNIFHNSGGADIYTNTDAFFLVDNMLDNYNGPGPITEVGTLSGDPQLNANYRPIETPPSPVINSGSAAVGVAARAPGCSASISPRKA